MSDFFSVFQTNLEARRREREPEYQRTFLERLFAPFEAPQQTLFSLTKGVADDGLQARDLWNALSHGARYFNPWSNEKPIDADEVRQVFFGEGAEGALKFGQNLAISLLYDPLLFTGLLKGATTAAKAGTALTQAVNVANKVLNPAELVIDGMVLASKNVVGPLAKTAAAKVLGEERATRWGTSLAQNWLNRYHGIDEDLIREVSSRDQRISLWRDEGFRIIKKSEQLGGAEAQKLLTQALELDGAYTLMSGGELTRDMQRSLDVLNARVDKLGIDRDLFWEVYGDYRKLDDKIGRELLESGAISSSQFAELQGTHLRRIYQAMENPLDYIKRVEDLNIPDVVKAQKAQLYENLNQFRDELTNLHRGGAKAQSPIFNLTETLGLAPDAPAARYFDDGAGRFNVHAFVDDLDEWLTKNPATTVDEVLEHVNTGMLGGVTLPADLNKTLANYVAGGLVEVKGSQFYADMIRGWSYNPSVTFRTFRERLEVVSRRSGIPDEVREAMGEITEAAPRLAAQVNDAGRTLETRRFLDTVAGAKRVDEETFDIIRQAERAGFDSPEGRNLMEAAAKKLGLSLDQLVSETPQLLDSVAGGVGVRVGAKGSRWASEHPNADLGHTFQVPDVEGYGEMAGMWTTPATGMLITKMEGLTHISDPNTALLLKTGELVRRGVGHFKAMKVLMDPTAQVRNFLGNAVLMDMSGTSPLRLDLLNKAARELVQYGKQQDLGRYMQLANDAGLALFQNTFTKAELAEFARHVASDASSAKGWKSVFTQAHAALQNFGADVVDKMAKAFEFNERLFKLTTFIDRVDRLESSWIKAGKLLTPEVRQNFARQAASIAEQALFNYADVPYMVDFARKYGIVPFITFPFKAVPFVAQTLYQHPHRVLRYDRAADEVNNWLAGTSDEAAKEIAALPEHVRDAMVVRLPFKDGQGRPQYIDLSYFMPWAVIQDFAKMAKPSEDVGAGMGFREGMLTPPAQVLIDAIRYNKDSLGRPIMDPNRGWEQNAGALGSFLWKFIAPPSTPGGSRADSIGRAMQAMAATSPERLDWVAQVGKAWRGGTLPLFVFPEAEERVMAGGGAFVPQAQAQMGGSGLTGAQGGLGALEGFLTGTLLGGSVASDAPQATYQAASAYQGNRTQAYKDIANVRANPSLSIAEKNKRIRRIMEALRRGGQELSETVARIG